MLYFSKRQKIYNYITNKKLSSQAFSIILRNTIMNTVPLEDITINKLSTKNGEYTMKIILSPAKEMNLKIPIEKNLVLSNKSQLILDKLKSFDDEKLKSSLKINEKILLQVKDYIKRFDDKQVYEAILLYNGLAFRWLDPSTLTEAALNYLDDRLTILSAFYGPIKPNHLIKPYRLDFNSKLKIEGQGLANFWKEEFNSHFSKNDLIVNLASDEFSSLLDRNKFNIVDFEFYENKNGKLAKHSTISKKARGRMVRFMAENQITELSQLKKFNYDGYKYMEELSDDKKFVFVRNK